MPTTLSTSGRPSASRPASASAATTARSPSGSASSGVMSLKTMPGSGKSGTSTTSRSSASRAASPRSLHRTFALLLAALRPRLARRLLPARGAALRRPDAAGPAADAALSGRCLGGRAARCRRLGSSTPWSSASLRLDSSSGSSAHRHVLGEGRDRGVLGRPCARSRALARRACSTTSVSLDFRCTSDARRQEDRGVDADRHADELREREVLQRARAQLHGARRRGSRRSGSAPRCRC